MGRPPLWIISIWRPNRVCDAAIALNLAAHTALAVYNGMGVGLDTTFLAICKYGGSERFFLTAVGLPIVCIGNVDVVSIFVKQ